MYVWISSDTSCLLAIDYVIVVSYIYGLLRDVNNKIQCVQTVIVWVKEKYIKETKYVVFRVGIVL